MDQSQLTWSAHPTHVRLFLIYLFIVICATAVQLLRLSITLGWTRNRRQVSLDTILDGSVDHDLLCQAGLANRVQASAKKLSAEDRAARRGKSSMALNVIRAAEWKFAYLWQRFQNQIQLLRVVIQLTVLISVLIVIYGAYPTLLDVYGHSHLTGLGALIETVRLLSTRLLMGLSVSALLLIAYGCCEHTLSARRLTWKYFINTSKDELTTE